MVSDYELKGGILVFKFQKVENSFTLKRVKASRGFSVIFFINKINYYLFYKIKKKVKADELFFSKITAPSEAKTLLMSPLWGMWQGVTYI